MTATFTCVTRIFAALAMLAGLLAGIRPTDTSSYTATYYDMHPTTIYLATYYDMGPTTYYDM